MRDRMRGKLADKSGLTMIEMLCATFILTLLCVMLSTGLSMAAYDYRMLTAEAETELLVNTIVSSLTDRLRDSTLSVDEATGKYSHSLGEIKKADAGGDAGITAPAQDTVVLEKKTVRPDGPPEIEQKALLPDGAYGTVVNKDGAGGKKRRYEVVDISISVIDASGAELKLPQPDGTTYPAPGKVVTYAIRLEVRDRITGVSRATPEDGIIVRCLNPVK